YKKYHVKLRLSIIFSKNHKISGAENRPSTFLTSSRSVRYAVLAVIAEYECAGRQILSSFRAAGIPAALL
ncbi:MAG: hypothetical protein IJU78_06430, partial [Clostridia bacterium]|nr:hypothetical protein [Clostridia bacterium]